MKTAQSFDPAVRRTYLGASEIGAILGVDQYRTPLDVYNEKLGLVPSFEGNKHTERGTRLEAVAADYYTELTGHKLRRNNADFAHPQHPFIVGHIDRKVVGEDRIAEIKCPSVASFRKLQREGLPKNYILQAQMYMGLTQTPKLTWIVFCADIWDMATFEIAFDQVIYNAAVAEAVRFWIDHIEPQIPPAADAKVDQEFYDIGSIGGDVTHRDDPAIIEAVNSYAEAKRIAEDGAELMEMAKQGLLNALEREHGRYSTPTGARIYYSQSPGRKTFDKKLLAATHPELDLTQFEKQGKPFDTLKVYLPK